ncbi:MAG: adenylosuccinate synthase [Phycisphaerales bacterium]
MVQAGTEPEARANRGGGGGLRPAAQGTAVVGLQWGDEGKGKIVHLLADRFDAVARYNGGANAGHSVQIGAERFALHLIPSGILHPGKPSVIGNGVVVDPDKLLQEIGTLQGRAIDCSGLRISDRAHVVMPWHKAEDEARERWLSEQITTGGTGAAGSVKPIGTTRRGIGPCYADKVQRGTAVRVGDLLRPEELATRLKMIAPLKTATLRALGSTESFDAETALQQCALWGVKLEQYITDTSALLMGLIGEGRRVLYEGANATLLDVDHGTYPYVTSSACTASGIPGGTGVPPGALGDVLGVCKAYSTRVGGGAMPTELFDELGERIRKRGREYGTTTGRPRRVGWLDLVAVRYSARLNGATGLCLMLLDVLAGLDDLRVCTAYDGPGGRTSEFTPDGRLLESVRPVYQTLKGFGGDLSTCRAIGELPPGARAYLDLIEETVGVALRFVSVGPDRAQTIEL